MRDGSRCDSTGLCYAGKCVSSLRQCQSTWGSASASSDSVCYTNFNSVGFVNGNCGVNGTNGDFMPCEKVDVECGLLNCQGGADEPLVAHDGFFKATASVKGRVFECKMVTDDAVYVQDGTACGSSDSMCVARKCVKVPEAKCPVGSNGIMCSGNGACTSLQRCLCETSWNGVACDSFLAVPKLTVGASGVNSMTLFGIVGAVLAVLIIAFVLMLFCTKRRSKPVFGAGNKIGDHFEQGSKRRVEREPSVSSSVSTNCVDNISMSKLNNAIMKLSSQPTKSILKKGTSEANFSAYLKVNEVDAEAAQQDHYEEIDNTDFNTHLNRQRFSIAKKSVSSSSLSESGESDVWSRKSAKGCEVDIEEQAVPSPQVNPFQSEFLKVQDYLNELKMLSRQNSFAVGLQSEQNVAEDLITPTKPAVMLMEEALNLYGSEASSGYGSSTASNSNQVAGDVNGKISKSYSIDLDESPMMSTSMPLDKRYSYLLATASTNSLNNLP